VEIAAEKIEDSLRVAGETFALPARDRFGPEGFVSRDAVMVAPLHHSADAFLTGKQHGDLRTVRRRAI
jgi:hypothetical protein